MASAARCGRRRQMRGVADDDGCAGWPTTSVARSPLPPPVDFAAGSSPSEWWRGGQIRPGLAGSGLWQRRRRLAGEASARSPSSRSPLSIQPSPTELIGAVADRLRPPALPPLPFPLPHHHLPRPMERIDERAVPWEKCEEASIGGGFEGSNEETGVCSGSPPRGEGRLPTKSGCYLQRAVSPYEAPRS
uniref:Uncharacterized protein n=1 Tax=Oryza barthii TaxID=65489 RepID=A0A0D3EJQ7_9ORYZ